MKKKYTMLAFLCGMILAGCATTQVVMPTPTSVKTEATSQELLELYEVDTPKGVVLTSGSAFNTTLKFKVVAKENMEIESLTLLHRGVSPDSLISQIVLLDDQGRRLGSPQGYIDGKVTLEFLPLLLKKGEQKMFTIVTSFNPSENLSAGSYQNDISEIGVRTKDRAYNYVTLLRGPEFSVIQGTSNIGPKMELRVLNTTPKEVELESKGVAHTEFAIFSEDKNYVLTHLSFKEHGNVAEGDIAAYHLRNTNGVIVADGTMENKVLTFKFFTPYVINNKKTVFTIFSDIASTGATRMSQLVFDQTGNHVAEEKTGILRTFLSTSTERDFPLNTTNGLNSIIIKEGTLHVEGVQQVQRVTQEVFGEFFLESIGEDMEIQGAEIRIDVPQNTITGDVAILIAGKKVAYIPQSVATMGTPTMYFTRFPQFAIVKGGKGAMLQLVGTVKDGTQVTSHLSNVIFKKLSSNRMSTVSSTSSSTAKIE